MVPISAWNKVLDQLGNLHEADKLMAEARERAAKAEAESEFLREKLKNTREELNTFKKKKRFFFLRSDAIVVFKVTISLINLNLKIA